GGRRDGRDGRSEREHESQDRPEWSPEVWREEATRPRVGGSAGARAAGARRVSGGPAPLPQDVLDELRQAGGSRRARTLGRLLERAADAYRHDRFGEARRQLEAIVGETPDSPAALELYGLTLYRLGRWREAIRRLDRYHELSGSVDQYPVVADCHRALGRPERVNATWEMLRRASPGAEVVSEGRLVLAGSLCDGGDLAGAIRLLEPHCRPLRHPAERHLRSWYALADLYERSGDLARARLYFGRVAAVDPELGGAEDRLVSLR
ncbi:MAG: tetratricopeptide repeat protein, partial [Acidimicrobiales bacterium]